MTEFEYIKKMNIGDLAAFICAIAMNDGYFVKLLSGEYKGDVEKVINVLKSKHIKDY